MSDIGDAVGRYMTMLFIFWITIAFAFGALCMWLVPKLWHWIIPIIHKATG